MRVLAEQNREVPALTARALSVVIEDGKQQSVGRNLDQLAENDEVCRFNDGDVKVYWFPREEGEGGSVSYKDLVDDSVDWDDVDVNTVPKDIAEEIASERLPYYRPRSFWSMTRNACQLGVIASFGMVVLGIGGLVDGSYGIGQNIAILLFRIGLFGALFALIGYTISLGLEYLAAKGHIGSDPLPEF